MAGVTWRRISRIRQQPRGSIGDSKQQSDRDSRPTSYACNGRLQNHEASMTHSGRSGATMDSTGPHRTQRERDD